MLASSGYCDRTAVVWNRVARLVSPSGEVSGQIRSCGGSGLSSGGQGRSAGVDAHHFKQKIAYSFGWGVGGIGRTNELIIGIKVVRSGMGKGT